MSSLDLTELQAVILDLQRRLGVLEETIHGQEQQDLPTDFLLGIYIDSQRPVTLSPETCRHWSRQALLLDAHQLLNMVRLTQDLHPWRPLLALLDQFAEADFAGAEVARAHLLDVAQDLLIAQGLELIQPRDVMGHQLPIRAAIAAISSR
jgi:hypothetical protein